MVKHGVPSTTRNTGSNTPISKSARQADDHRATGGRLLAEKQFSQNVMESLPGLFFVLDDQRRYMWWNENLRFTLDCSDEELKNRAAGFKVSPKDRPRVLEALEKCAKARHSASIE